MAFLNALQANRLILLPFGFHNDFNVVKQFIVKYLLIVLVFVNSEFTVCSGNMEASEYFFINITGQIDFAYYPIGFDGTRLFCRYDVVAGSDWELISGMSSGVTQNASTGMTNEKVVFNMPLEMMFKSTNPFGCKCIEFVERFQVS